MCRTAIRIFICGHASQPYLDTCDSRREIERLETKYREQQQRVPPTISGRIGQKEVQCQDSSYATTRTVLRIPTGNNCLLCMMKMEMTKLAEFDQEKEHALDQQQR
jgi:hypothetical protein